MKDNTPRDDGLTKIDPIIREKFEKLPEEKKKKQQAKTFIMFSFELFENQKKFRILEKF